MDGEATLYVRLSLMMPREGMRESVAKLHHDLIAWLPGQPGFIHGYVIVDGDPQGRVGHIDIWRSQESAAHAAQTDHVLAVRAELLLQIEEESHAEHSYVVVEPTAKP